MLMLACLFIMLLTANPDEESDEVEVVSVAQDRTSTEVDSTPTNDDITPPIENVLFTLDEALFRPSVENLEPNNEAFLIITGEMQNQTESRECVYARDVRLILDDETYEPQNNLMDAVKSTFEPERDFIGAFSGLCLDAGESVNTFVAFDVPVNQPEDMIFSFIDVPSEIAFQFPSQTGALVAYGILPPDEATSVATLWTETPTATSTNTPTITRTPSITNTSEPSATITSTPRGTNTRQPTQTQRPALTPTPPASAVPTLSAQRTTMYITSTVNVRPCPRLNNTECAARTQLATGTEIEAVDRVTGDAHNNSTSWWRIVYNGEILYVHSDFVSANRPVVNSAPPAQNQQPSQPQQPVDNQSPAPSTQWSCSGNIYNCPDFEGRCSELYDYFNSCPGDPSGLDGDDDGVPCESQCGG